MSEVHSLAARVAVSITAMITGLLITSSSRIHLPSCEAFRRTLCIAFPLSRIALFCFIFFVSRIPPHGDVVGYYYPEAQAVSSGLLPYLDFRSSYGPLHSYVDAIVIRIWNSPLSLILMATLIEASILPLWFKVGRMFAMERDIRIASVLYFFCPVSFQFALIDGQNSVAIAACIVLAMLLLSRNKVALCGVLVGLSIITVKFLPLLYVPSFVRASAQRVRWLLGFTATLVAGYSFFLLRHAPIFQPLLFEGGMRTSGNLPYLVEAVAGVTLPARIWDLLVIAVLFSIFIFSGLKKHERTIPIDLNYLTSTMLAFTFSLLLLAKKSAPAYMMMVLFPLCLLLSATTRLRRCFGLSFLVIAIAEPSIWFTLLGAINAPALHLALSRHRPLTVAFLGLQATMVLGYGWLLWMSLLRLATTSQLQQSCSTNRLDSIDAPLNASI